MNGKRKRDSELDPPPMAATNSEAFEILRVWTAPGGPQELTIHTCWQDPSAWGLLLVDVARHVAQAYQPEGHNPQNVLERIRELFEAEWASPTSPAEDLTDEAG